MNFNLLTETGLDSNLAEIVAKLQSLMDSFWLYIVIALAAVVVIWGAYIGIKIAIAHRNEEKINARDMIKKEYVAILLLEAMCRDKEFHDSVLENVLRAKENYIRKVQR